MGSRFLYCWRVSCAHAGSARNDVASVRPSKERNARRSGKTGKRARPANSRARGLSTAPTNSVVTTVTARSCLFMVRIRVALRTLPQPAALLLTVLVVWGCSSEVTVAARSYHPLAFSEPVLGKFERRLVSSAMLPDSVFGRIVHLDLHEEALSVVDALGSFVAVLSYGLEPLQVVGRPGEGPGELARPVASRVDSHRILVMDQGRRRFLEFARSTKQANALSGKTIADLRGSSSASLGTDFILSQDSAIVVPVHEGPTYLAAVSVSENSRLRFIGPIYSDVSDDDQQLLRLFDRVSSFGERDILVWDDDDATLVLSGQSAETRWSFPNRYRGGSGRRSVSPDGTSMAITLGNPRLKGWGGYGDSMCLVLRQADNTGVDLVLFTSGGKEDTTPTVRKIEADVTTGTPVSCGVSGNRLFVADAIGISRFLLLEEGEET